MPKPTVPLHQHQQLRLRLSNYETLAAIDTAIFCHLDNPHPRTIDFTTRIALDRLAALDTDEAEKLEARLIYNDQGGPLQYRQKFLNQLT